MAIRENNFRRKIDSKEKTMDCCAKKRVRITSICLVLVLLCTSCFATDLKLGEKKINLDGKECSVEVHIKTIAEYDFNGKILHSKVRGISGFFEGWYKYDSNGNEIWYGKGHSYGELIDYSYEEWNDYNSLNQNIHGENSAGRMWENEFDSQGRLVLRRYYLYGVRYKTPMNNIQYFYDSHGKLIRTCELIPLGKESKPVLSVDYKYDAKGNRISSKSISHRLDGKEVTHEEFWEYDAEGHEIAYFKGTEAKNRGLPFEIYEYEFWMNGNIRTKITYNMEYSMN